MTLHRRARFVRRQLQHRQLASQLLPPVRQLLLQHLALQPLTLPHRIVCILYFQLRQRRFASFYICFIKRRHFPHQNAWWTSHR